MDNCIKMFSGLQLNKPMFLLIDGRRWLSLFGEVLSHQLTPFGGCVKKKHANSRVSTAIAV
jgi:hypothetical protein